MRSHWTAASRSFAAPWTLPFCDEGPADQVEVAVLPVDGDHFVEQPVRLGEPPLVAAERGAGFEEMAGLEIEGV